MNKYIIFQLSDENPKIRDLSFMTPQEVEAISDEFELVARIDGRSYDEAFRIGNFVVPADDTLREVVGSMRSVSVGDIIYNIDADEYVVVCNYGFTTIEMKETV